MDTTNTQSKPSLDSFVGQAPVSQKPSLASFVKPYDGSQDINNAAAGLGMTNTLNSNPNNLPGMGFVTNVGTGIAKSAIDTAKGVGDIVGLKPTDYGNNVLQSSQDTGAGTIGKTVGEAIGNTGQFMAPGGAEESAFAKSIPIIEKIKGLFGLSGKAGEIATKVGQIGSRAAITGASTAGVSAVQSGGNMNQTVDSGLLGTVAGGLGQTLETFGKGIATSLAKSGFKLSPGQEAKVINKSEQAAQFIANNKILGNESTKYKSLVNTNNEMETALQSSLPKNFGVSKQDIISNINDNVESLKNEDPAIYDKARGQADKAISLLNSQKYDNKLENGYITAKDSLNGKRSYGSLAFNQGKALVKDPSVSSEGAYAIEKGYQDALHLRLEQTNTNINVPNKLKPIFGGKSQVTLPEFNKVYSQAISAKDLTRLAQFKNDAGLFGRMFGLFAGKTLAHAAGFGPLGEIVGMGGGEILANKGASALRNISERTVQANGKMLPNVSKGILGVSRTNPSDQQLQQ